MLSLIRLSTKPRSPLFVYPTAQVERAWNSSVATLSNLTFAVLIAGSFMFTYGAVLPVWVGFGSVVALTLVVVRKGPADAKDESVGFCN